MGRFYGNADDQSSQGSRFYENLKHINEVEAGLKGRMKDRQPTEGFKADNPEYRLVARANYAEGIIRRLNKQKHELMEKEAPREKIKAIEDRIRIEMQKFNNAVQILKDKAA